MTKSFIHFVRDNKGWDVNVVISQLLFWLVGFPVVLEYGWSSSTYNDDGGIPSGVDGNGAFVITLFFAAASLFVWTSYLVSWLRCLSLVFFYLERPGC